MIDHTERHPAAVHNDLTGEDQDGMAKEAQP